MRGMSELPEKQIKRLRNLINDAETNLAAAKELLTSVLGNGSLSPRHAILSLLMKKAKSSRAFSMVKL